MNTGDPATKIKPTRKPSAKSLANLKPPYKPGESGNPAGSPTIGLRNKLMAAAAKCSSQTDVEELIRQWWADAKSDNYAIRSEARRDLIGHVIGKPKMETDIVVHTTSTAEVLAKIDALLGL